MRTAVPSSTVVAFVPRASGAARPPAITAATAAQAAERHDDGGWALFGLPVALLVCGAFWLGVWALAVNMSAMMRHGPTAGHSEAPRIMEPPR